MESIGKYKYNFLKQFKKDALSEEDKKSMEEYEKRNLPSPEALENSRKYWESINKPKQKIEYYLTSVQLRDLFLEGFRSLNGHEFIMNETSKSALKTMCDYFSNNDEFLKSSCLSDLSKPDFQKGLLVVGGFGNGKTTMFKVFQSIFTANSLPSFGMYSANDVVGDFESISNGTDKEYFWKRMTHGQAVFDDVKTERIASNYGKVNLFKELLEKRCYSPIRTHITCNYSTSNPGNLKSAIEEFGELYGGRVYDRLFEMFNIIEFKGESFRR